MGSVKRTVKLTGKTIAQVIDNNTLKVVTHQSVGGSGARNMIVWALYAYNKGFSNLIVSAPDADVQAKESLLKATDNANELLQKTDARVILELL